MVSRSASHLSTGPGSPETRTPAAIRSAGSIAGRSTAANPGSGSGVSEPGGRNVVRRIAREG